MRVIRLTLAYDGTDFRGWAQQRDPAVRTVEGSLAEVVTHVVRHDVRLSVAGRTDAGVHARGQVASFLTSSRLAPERMQRAINGSLSPEIVVVDAREAREGFDARFSATAREYRYVIDTASNADPFTARYVWHRPTELSIGRMREAAHQSDRGARLHVVLPASRSGEADRARPPAGLGEPRGHAREPSLPCQRVPPPDGSDPRGHARPRGRGQDRAEGRSNDAGGAQARRDLAAGARSGPDLRTRVVRDANLDGAAMRVANFDGLAFPQVALPIGRDARPISHV